MLPRRTRPFHLNQIFLETINTTANINEQLGLAISSARASFKKGQLTDSADFFIDAWRLTEALRNKELNSRTPLSERNSDDYERVAFEKEGELQTLSKTGIFALHDAAIACLFNEDKDYRLKSLYPLAASSLTALEKYECRGCGSVLYPMDPLGLLLSKASNFVDAANALAHFGYLRALPFRKDHELANIMVAMPWIVAHSSSRWSKPTSREALLREYSLHETRGTGPEMGKLARWSTGYKKCTQERIRYSCGDDVPSRFVKCSFHSGEDKEHQMCSENDILYKDLPPIDHWCRKCLYTRVHQ